MSAETIVENFEKDNITLWVDRDNDLHFKGPKGCMTTLRKESLKDHKSDIVKYLKKRRANRACREVCRMKTVVDAFAEYKDTGLRVYVQTGCCDSSDDDLFIKCLSDELDREWDDCRRDFDEYAMNEWVKNADRAAEAAITGMMTAYGLFVDDRIWSIDEIRQKIRAKSKYDNFLMRVISIMTQRKIIVETDGGYRKNPDYICMDCREELGKLRETEEKLDYSHGFVKYLETCCLNLTELFRGNIRPLDMLFPEGDNRTAVSTYRDSLSSKNLNQIANTAVRHILSRKKSIKILEIGAGVGGTSDSLMSVIPKDSDTEYYYTDLSEYFLNAAKQRYKDRKNVVYKIFDVNEDTLDQKFDLIVSSNVLHNAKNGVKILYKLRDYLNDEGMMVIIDAISEPLYYLTSIEFNDGLDNFEDFRKKDGSIFFTRKQWEDMFLRVGLKIVGEYPRKSEAFEKFGQGIFVVAVGHEPEVVSEDKVRAILEEHLDKQDIPDEIIVNNQFSYENEELPEGMRTQEAYANELEKRIAEVWKKVLNQEVINRSDDFFSLGGDSLLLSRAVSCLIDDVPEVGRIKWGDLMRLMLENPVLTDFSEKIADSYGSNDTEVVLYDNSDVNIVVLFHAGLGTVTPYSGLIQYFKEKALRVKLVGIQCADTNDYLNHDIRTLYRELGKKYAKELVKYAGCNVHFIGHCVGGIIALETAGALSGTLKIRTLNMISTNLYTRGIETAESIQNKLQDETLTDMTFRKLVDGCDEENKGFADHHSIFRHNLTAVPFYVPEKYDGLTNVYMCSEDVQDFYVNTLGVFSEKIDVWKKALSNVQGFEIEGNHITCMTKENLYTALIRNMEF